MNSELTKNIYRIVFFCVRVAKIFGGIEINTENIANFAMQQINSTAQMRTQCSAHYHSPPGDQLRYNMDQYRIWLL